MEKKKAHAIQEVRCSLIKILLGGHASQAGAVRVLCALHQIRNSM